jgi:hypothetical protein
MTDTVVLRDELLQWLSSAKKGNCMAILTVPHICSHFSPETNQISPNIVPFIHRVTMNRELQVPNHLQAYLGKIKIISTKLISIIHSKKLVRLRLGSHLLRKAPRTVPSCQIKQQVGIGRFSVRSIRKLSIKVTTHKRSHRSLSLVE